LNITGIFNYFSPKFLTVINNSNTMISWRMYLENKKLPARLRAATLSVCTGKEISAMYELEPYVVQLGTSNTFDLDKTRDGWTLEVEGPPLSPDANELRFSTFLNEGEDYVNGEEMLRRGRESSDALGLLAGQRQGEMLLRRQDLIPVELRGMILVFAGTIWRVQDGYRCVFFLYWDGRRWKSDFDWLDCDDWNDDFRLARLPQVPLGA